MRQLKVKKDPENEIPAEIFEQAIIEIAAAMRKISATRLTRSAIVALIYDKSKIQKGQIEVVLNNLDRLEEIWLKPKKKKHA